MWGTFDIETLTYIDGVLVDTKTLEAEARKMSDAEKRRRVSVDVALLQVYTETLGFKMFKGASKWEDMIAYCCYERITTLWNYNAVFDFANIDYWLLNNPYAERMKAGEELDEEGDEKKGGVYHKIGAKNLGSKILFKELSGNMGQRYMYELHYKGRGKNRHTRAFKLVFYDFRNILKGGLAKILEELDVEDNEGNKLRKLAMEYQAVNYDNMTADELAYVEMDVKGLYFAIKEFNWELVSATNGRRNLLASKPSGLTASGIAKKELLYFLEGYARDDINVKHYRRKHPITLKQDIYLRETKLYRGGICYLNSNYCNIPIERVFYRYDVNSEYPSVMYDMRDLYGKLERCSYEYYQNHKKEKTKCFIFRFSYLSWVTKKGKVPLFTNPFTGKNEVSGVIQKGIKNKYGFCMFEEEFNALCEFYDFTYELENILVIKARSIKGYRAYVEHYYEIKNEAKKQANTALQANAKLMLNGAYGKLSERSDRSEIRHEINKETGCVHQVEEKPDKDSVVYSGLSIVQGAYVTALARIKIMRYIIEVCGENLVDEFIYVDTDSVHAFKEYSKADPYKLGALKLEAKCYCGKFLGKKLYAEFETVGKCEGEVHSKGCNITKVCASILKDFNVDDMKHLDFAKFCEKFAFGQRFTVNAGLNVRGGKCILPVDKDLIKDCRLKENTIRLARIGENEFNEV